MVGLDVGIFHVYPRFHNTSYGINLEDAICCTGAGTVNGQVGQIDQGQVSTSAPGVLKKQMIGEKFSEIFVWDHISQEWIPPEKKVWLHQIIRVLFRIWWENLLCEEIFYPEKSAYIQR